MTDDLWDRYRTATKNLDRNVFWQPRRNPQQVLRAWPTPPRSSTSAGTSTPPAAPWPGSRRS